MTIGILTMFINSVEPIIVPWIRTDKVVFMVKSLNKQFGAVKNRVPI